MDESQACNSVFVAFGSRCFVHVPAEKRRKLDNTVHEMVFVGYDENSKAYRCYDQGRNRMVVSRDVRFADTIEDFSVLLPASGSHSVGVTEPEVDKGEDAGDDVRDAVHEKDGNASDSEYESFVDSDAETSSADTMFRRSRRSSKGECRSDQPRASRRSV